MKPEDADDVLTVDEAAAFLKVGPNVLYEAVTIGQVPHRRVGKKLIRFSRRALLHWLACGHSPVAKEGQ